MNLNVTRLRKKPDNTYQKTAIMDRIFQNVYLIFFISIKIIKSRFKQILFGILGVTLGVTSYIISISLMYGYEKYFIQLIIDIEPHIVIKTTRYEKSQFYQIRDREDRVVETLGLKAREMGKLIGWQSLIETLRTEPEITEVFPRLELKAIIRKGDFERSITLLGLDPGLVELESKAWNFRESLGFRTLQSRKDGLILGIDLAKALDMEKPGQTVNLILPNGINFPLNVVDFFETGITSIDSHRALVNLKFVQGLVAKGDHVNSIAIFLKNPKRAEEIAKKIQLFTDYEVEPWTKSLANFLRVLSVQNSMTLLIVSVILLVSAFGIFGINLMMVMEKRKEIAIMQALGLTEKDILFIFVTIGIIIATVGYLIGIALSIIVMNYLESVDLRMGTTIKVKGFVLDKSPWYFFKAYLYANLFTFLACIYPAYKASKVNPVEVFRSA